MNSKKPHLPIEEIRKGLLACFWSKHEPITVGDTSLHKYLAPELYAPREVLESDADFSLLDFGIEDVEEAEDNIYKVRLNNGSWIVFYKALKKAVIFHSKAVSDRAESVASILMNAADWLDHTKGLLLIEDGGKCPADGPSFDDIQKFNPSYAGRAIDPELKQSDRPTNDMQKTNTGSLSTSVGQPPVLTQPKPVTHVSRPAPQKAAYTAYVVSKIIGWGKEHAPAMLVGSATGATIRISAHFAFAAIATTVPSLVATLTAAPVAATILSAVAVSALAGGTTKLVVTSFFGGEKKQQPHWRRNAFMQGAAFGALGGTIGAGVADFLRADGLLHGFVFGHPVPANDNDLLSLAKTPVIRHDPLPIESAPKLPLPQPDVISIEQSAPPVVVEQNVPPIEQVTKSVIPQLDAAPIEPVIKPTIVPHVVAPSVEHITKPVVVDHGAVAVEPLPSHKLLPADTLKKLPIELQKLATSKKPQDILHFCKEASFLLMNGHNRSAENLKVGARLIEEALKVAEKAGLHNHTVAQLHADEAYVKAWGIGTNKNIPEAIQHAKQAGRAVHNYGGKLLRHLRVAQHG